ncbi:MAG: hypothetical protein ABEH80_09305 [Halobaculum sp.]
MNDELQNLSTAESFVYLGIVTYCVFVLAGGLRVSLHPFVLLGVSMTLYYAVLSVLYDRTSHGEWFWER